MSKCVLIERNGAPLRFEEKTSGRNPKALGHLEGIAAQYNKPTRNGRRYPKELWEKVINSDDYKEMMDTMTCFCENDHPADNTDRIETSIKEISAVLTNLEISDDGNVYAGFDILDTPQGHILKSLADYGCSIGVSSRGLGDEIQRDGEIIIDPETFQFYAFDMVVMPAVKSARPSVTESRKKRNATKQSLSETFAKEVEMATSVAELKSLKRVVSNLQGFGSITESINIKLKSMKDGDDILSTLEKDLGNLSEDNVRLTEQVDALNRKLSANNIRYQRLSRAYSENRKAVKTLRKRLQSNMVESAHLKVDLYDGAKETENAVSKLNCTQNELNENKKIIKVLNSNNLTECKKLESELKSTKTKLAKTEKKLSEANKDLVDVKRELVETRKEMSSAESRHLNEIKAIKTESDSKVSKIADNGNKKLTEERNKTSDEILSLNESLNKANNTVTKLTEEKTNLENNLEQSRNAVRKLASEKKSLNGKIKALEKSLKESNELVNELSDCNKTLRNDNHNLNEQVKTTTSKQVLSEKESKRKLSSYKKALAEKNQANELALSKYLETKCIQNGLKIETVKPLLPNGYNIQDIDRVVNEMSDRKRRYDALPFAIPTNSARIVESVNNANMSSEDKQTMTFLESACK